MTKSRLEVVVAHRTVDLFLELDLQAPDRILAVPLDGTERRHMRVLPQYILGHRKVPFSLSSSSYRYHRCWQWWWCVPAVAGKVIRGVGNDEEDLQVREGSKKEWKLFWNNIFYNDNVLRSFSVQL